MMNLVYFKTEKRNSTVNIKVYQFEEEKEKRQENHLNFVNNSRRIKLTTFKSLFNIFIWKNKMSMEKNYLAENWNISEFSMAEQSEFKP